MSRWFDLLRGFFGRRDQPAELKVEGVRGLEIRSPGDGKGRNVEYLIIIGLDFGTAYTKCVVRDALVRDPGKAHPVAFELTDGWTYLMPSVVVRTETGFSSAFDRPVNGTGEEIDYLKMRLVSELDRQRGKAWREGEPVGEMQVVVAWYLAQVLARVGQEIRRHWPDFSNHLNDECFVNICVPIAHADGSQVEQCLLDAVCAARNAVGPAGTEAPAEEKIRAELSNEANLRRAREHCYTYPEASANLQSYLKSRARRPGLYLFADVGAGTVDLSFFQLLEDTGNEAPLRYYHASVLDTGSSRLELKAREMDPDLSLVDLIATKEGRSGHSERRLAQALDAASKAIHDEVATGVGDGVAVTESKLHRDPAYQRSQMKRVLLMHSGGGYSPEPYGRATQYFYRKRQWRPVPNSEPLPEPNDIVWNKQVGKLPFTRLSVAYGLAFARYELDGHRFPSETAVNPDSPLPPNKDRPEAPTKDEV